MVVVVFFKNGFENQLRATYKAKAIRMTRVLQILNQDRCGV